MTRAFQFLCVVTSAAVLAGCQSATQPSSVPLIARGQDLSIKPEVYAGLDKACAEELDAVRAFKRLEPPYAAMTAYKAKKTVDPAAVKNRPAESLTPVELSAKYPVFGKAVDTLLDEAGKAFAKRILSPETAAKYAFLSKGSKGGMKFLLLLDSERKTPTGRYFPLGKMVLLVNPDKIAAGAGGQGFADPQYADRLLFVISHELGHAVAMHSEEQATAADEAGDATEAVGGGLSDAAIGTAYSTFGYDFGASSLVNAAAESQFTSLGLSETEFQKYAEKKHHVATAVLGMAAGTAMSYAGSPVSVGTSSPLSDRTTFVIKKMTGMGLDGGDAIKLLASGVKDLNFSYTFVAHSQRDEFEADRIGYALYKSAGRPAQEPIVFFQEMSVAEDAAKAKSPTVFDAHPPAKDRAAKLQAVK